MGHIAEIGVAMRELHDDFVRKLEAQEKRLTDRRALLDAAAEEWQESLKDDVCTQAFAVEHQSQRITAFESKFAEFEAKVTERLDKNLDVATRIDGALEKRIVADLRKDRERFEDHSMAELEEVRTHLLQRLSDTQQLVQRVAQEQENDRAAVREQWTAHASKLELRFESKFEDLRQLLNRDGMNAGMSAFGTGLNSGRQLAEASRAPPVAAEAAATAKLNKVDHDVQSLCSKFESLEARIGKLETELLRNEALVSRSDRLPLVSEHAAEKSCQGSPLTNIRIRTPLRRDSPMSDLTRQLQCSARAAELREQHLQASGGDIPELRWKGASRASDDPESCTTWSASRHLAASDSGIGKSTAEASSATLGLGCWKDAEQQNADSFSTSTFAPRSPGGGPATSNGILRAEGEPPARLSERERSGSPERDLEREDSPRTNGADNFSFQAMGELDDCDVQNGCPRESQESFVTHGSESSSFANRRHRRAADPDLPVDHKDEASSLHPVPRLGVLERIERLRAQASAPSTF